MVRGGALPFRPARPSICTVMRSWCDSGSTAKVCVALPEPRPEISLTSLALSHLVFRSTPVFSSLIFLPSGGRRRRAAVGAGNHDHRIGLRDRQVIRRVDEIAHRGAHARDLVRVLALAAHPTAAHAAAESAVSAA